MKITHLVTATHPTGYVSFNREPFAVRQEPGDRGGFYAMHPKLGCGKTYATPQHAIRCMCEAHSISVQAIEDAAQ
jgi:hypothetical protein